MISTNYIRSYLRDILGKTPEEAIAFLQSSPGSFLFRSMRVVEDVSYNPETHDLAKPDDFEEGRTTLKVVGQHIVDCEYEYGSGFKMVYLKPLEPEPKEDPRRFKVLEPGAVFVFKSPKPLKDLARFDIECQPRLSRGWYIEEITAMAIVNPRSVSVGKRVKTPPKRPTVSPLFYDLPW